jgi:hypothetical protein
MTVIDVFVAEQLTARQIQSVLTIAQERGLFFTRRAFISDKS